MGEQAQAVPASSTATAPNVTRTSRRRGGAGGEEIGVLTVMGYRDRGAQVSTRAAT